MLTFTLPSQKNKTDVLSFYGEFETNNETCIGYNNFKDFDAWLAHMTNRHTGKNLPKGFVRENFYLCYDKAELVGVFSLKFELTPYLKDFGGHIGYAVRPSKRNRGIAGDILKQGLNISKQFGFKHILCVCDDDNLPSEKVILKNGGVFENKLYDAEEKVFVKRYWINL